jgi:hypothetical protein
MRNKLGVDNEALLRAGLELMARAGKPLTKLPSRGRAMLYALPNGETVRVRTCNDHVLLTIAESASLDAKLNTEGTDWLLHVMPEKPRTAGDAIAYLIPVAEAVEAARNAQRGWLAGKPNTKGDNRTWTLQFYGDGRISWEGFDTKWARYRLNGSAPIKAGDAETGVGATGKLDELKAEIEQCRQRIAQVANAPLEAVKITIDFSL